MTSPTRRQTLDRLAAACLAPGALLAACGSTPPGPRPTAQPQPQPAPVALPSRDSDYRLVNRLTWGATDAELDRLRRSGRSAWLQEQLQAGAPPRLPAAVQARIDAFTVQQRPLPALLSEMEDLRKTADAAASEEARKAARENYQHELTRLARESASRHLLRALYSPGQLHEQMTWFWFNHFNVHQYKGQVRAMLADYEERAIRPHAMGPFRAMLGAVARHPAMLRYLDNAQNAAGHINENHAREMLELHTLGIDGGYTQRDVQELARVLTGHGINFGEAPRLRPALRPLYVRDGAYEFNPARHDFGDKLVLGHSIRGRGAAELDEVLDLLAAHPSTARFLSRQMAQYLLSDNPPPALVGRMAQAFNAEGGRTGAVLSPLVQAAEFTGDAGAKFKDPMHFVVSAVRAAYGERIILNTGPMQYWLNRLGQGLYNRQTPDGYPLTADAWNGSGQMATRFEIARAIGSGSAGLFRTEAGEEPAMAAEQPAFPQLARPIYYNVVRAGLREETRVALDHAGSPQDWNTLYLASPEFMFR